MVDRELKKENLDVVLSFCDQMRDICRPLFEKTKLSSFNYARKYSDGSNFGLSTDPEWFREYYIDKYYDDVDDHQNLVALKYQERIDGFRRFFRSQFDDCPAGPPCRSQHGIDFSLTMVSMTPEYYDCYYFGSEVGKHTDELLSIYNQYPTIFSHFIFYFHDRAEGIIKELEKEKNHILIPSKKVVFEDNLERFTEQPNHSLSDDEAKDLFNAFTNKKYRLTIGGDEFFLTLRETQTLSLWLKGNTVKQIAQHLNLSVSTVETHIEKLKIKLQYQTKSEIVKNVIGTPHAIEGKSSISSNMSLLDSIIWESF